MPCRMEEIYHALNRADLFVSIGTSGAVYPAAGFVREARAAGARTLELNMEPSQGSYWFDEARHGPASVLVPAWVEEKIGSASCRERVCQYVSISGVDVALKTKTTNKQ